VSHHIVEMARVSFSYPDGTEALRDLSFRITHGEAVGLVGPNGAGKSTLLLHLNGTLRVQRGVVTIGDGQVTRDTLREVRRTVGMVFQNPDDQLFMPLVEEDVAFGPLNLGLDADTVEERVVAALETVGALDLRKRPPHHLSGGQKKAVAIATVLAMGPDILVMDEPGSSLDPKSRRALISLLKGFRHSKIIASHDLDLVWDVCERVILLNDGRIVADGPAEEILSNRPLLEENGLELPLSLQGRTSAPLSPTASE